MAYLKFIKEGEPSIKKTYIPASAKFKKHVKIWKIISIIEALIIIGLVYGNS